MARRTVILAIIAAAILAAGIAFWVVRDVHSANAELYAYQGEIVDIRNQVEKSNDIAKLKSFAIRLGRIDTSLSYIPSRHRLASLFTDLERRVSDAMNDDTSVAVAINQKIGPR